MSIHPAHQQIPASLRGCAVALGNFDGVHLGHRAVVAGAVELAAAAGRTAVAMTFHPHPSELFSGVRVPRLSTLDRRADLLFEHGISAMIAQQFTREFAQQSAEDFVRQVLVARLGIVGVSVGADFRFGRGRAGTVAMLRSLGEVHGFAVHAAPPVLIDGEPVSSTRIRAAVADGQVDQAERLLGRPFELEGSVVPGRKQGRRLGYPTANLTTPQCCVMPANGVYACEAVLDDGKRVAAAVSVGVRPTFETNGGIVVEAHLLDFEGDLYGRGVRLHFLQHLRDELRFSGPDALVAQMDRDIAAVRQVVTLRRAG